MTPSLAAMLSHFGHLNAADESPPRFLVRRSLPWSTIRSNQNPVALRLIAWRQPKAYSEIKGRLEFSKCRAT